MGFNFGAKVGEIIQGNLARGAGGKFVNAQDMRVAMDFALVRRLRAANKAAKARKAGKGKKKKGGGKGGGGSSKQTPAEKRKDLLRNAEFKATGMTAAEVNALASFMEGNQISPAMQQTLAGRGLMEFGNDGAARMSTLGARFMRAANRGDERAALDAFSKARDKIAEQQAQLDADEQAQADIDNQLSELEIMAAEAIELGDRSEAGTLRARRQRLSAQAEAVQEKANKLRRKMGLELIFKAYLAKHGITELLNKACPFCSGGNVAVYKDHGGAAVCPDCQMTFDPVFHFEGA